MSPVGNTLYINSTFGWPTIFTQDLPEEGPGYPLTTPGVRLKVTPNDQFVLLAGLSNGDPSGAGFTGLPEILDPAGLNFRLRDPPLLLGEVQYQYNQNKAAPGLAGTVKLGAWYHFGKFDDEHFDVDGKSLADPSSNGVALTHSGDYGIYGVIDQMVWRLPGDDPKKGVGAFARAFLSPSDRNLIDFSANAGVNFMGLWDMRPDDSFGLAAAILSSLPISEDSIAKKLSLQKFAVPLRNYELVVELTYQASIVAGWTVQPDFQYIFHPGGGVIDPINPYVGRIPDAAVFGLRTMVSFWLEHIAEAAGQSRIEQARGFNPNLAFVTAICAPCCGQSRRPHEAFPRPDDAQRVLPKQPHCHGYFLGGRQGERVGTVLAKCLLNEADDKGWPIYLETQERMPVCVL